MTGRDGFAQDLRVVLRRRDFRRLFATRLVSQAGDGAFQAGLASLFFFSPERATTAGAVAAAFAVALLPYTLVGPFAGVLLDRWRRRQVLLVVNLVRTLAVLGVAAIVVVGDVGPVLYVAVLGCLSLNRFFLTGLGAGLPHVVPPRELVTANAVSPTSGTVAALLGGALGYGVRVTAGPGDRTDALILLLAAGAYLTSAGLALRMHRDLLGPDAPRAAAVRDVARGIVAGAAHLASRRPAVHALAVIAVHRAGLGVTTLATILLCRNRFTEPGDTDGALALLGTVVGLTGAGYALAAITTPAAVRRFGVPTWVAVSCLLAAAAQASFALVPTVPVLLVSGVLLGVAVQGTKICVDAILQSTVDDAFLGRVFSVHDMIFNGVFVVAAGTAVLLLPADGLSQPVLGAVAVAYALAALGHRRATARAHRSAPVTLRS